MSDRENENLEKPRDTPENPIDRDQADQHLQGSIDFIKTSDHISGTFETTHDSADREEEVIKKESTASTNDNSNLDAIDTAKEIEEAEKNPLAPKTTPSPFNK